MRWGLDSSGVHESGNTGLNKKCGPVDVHSAHCSHTSSCFRIPRRASVNADSQVPSKDSGSVGLRICTFSKKQTL